MISSSIQATQNNPYGESKRAGENLMFEYSRETGAKVLVYRFPTYSESGADLITTVQWLLSAII